MKKYNFLFLSILKRKKLRHFSILVFFIMTVLYVTILGLNNGVLKKYIQIKEENIDHNYLTITANKEYDLIVSDIIDTGYFEKYYPLIYYNNFIYMDNDLIDLIDGHHIQTKYDAIVPKSYGYKINDIIQLNINSNLFNLKVKGVYEKIEYNYSINNYIDNPIFLSLDFLEEIIDVSDTNEVIVKVADYDDINIFLNKISKLDDYNVKIYDANSTLLDRYHSFSTFITSISKSLIFFSFLFLIIIQFIVIHDIKLDIAIMKSLGYSNVNILILILISLWMLFIISLPLSAIFIILVNIFFSNLIIINFNLLFEYLIYFSFITLIVSCITYFLISKISIIKLIKN